jgi:hypothetical protein
VILNEIGDGVEVMFVGDVEFVVVILLDMVVAHYAMRTAHVATQISDRIEQSINNTLTNASLKKQQTACFFSDSSYYRK